MSNGAGELRSLKWISQVFGLFAGVAAIVYVAGGVVLALRLGLEDLDPEAAIAQLPREFLITIGVATVVLPAIAGAATYLAWRLWPGGAPLSLLRWLALRPLAVAALLVAPGIGIEIAKDGLRLTLLWWSLAAFAIALIWAFALSTVRDRIKGAYGQRWSQAAPIALMSVLYGALLLPASVVVGATLPLLDVKLCTTGGSAHVGSLVGETDERIYFGEDRAGEDDRARRLVSLPASAVNEVFVGDEAEDKGCDPKLVKPAAG